MSSITKGPRILTNPEYAFKAFGLSPMQCAKRQINDDRYPIIRKGMFYDSKGKTAVMSGFCRVEHGGGSDAATKGQLISKCPGIVQKDVKVFRYVAI